MIDLVMIAGGGHAAEVYSYLLDLGEAGRPVNLLGVIDDGVPPGPWEGTRILGGFDRLAEIAQTASGPVYYISCVGSNSVRRQLVTKADALGPKLVPWTLRHPSAQIGRAVEIGAGTLLAPGVIVTTRTKIGRHCILNAKASVHHDCVVGDFVNINPGATVAGTVRLSDGVFLGVGATVINGRAVGANSIVGAGATVTRDLPADVTAVGVPARVIKRHGLLG